MDERPPCPACAHGHTRPIGDKAGFSLHRCAGCSSLFVHPLPAANDATRLYADAYATVEPTPRVVVKSLERLVDGAGTWRREGRWLDVGFGDGSLLEVVAGRGWHAYGTEVARPALERARDRGWTVGETIDGFPREGFDVVSMVELVEHVPDATPFLREAFAMLRPGGLLYVSTPNARSLNARVLGTAWSVVSPPDHVVLFSPRALTGRLAGAGFRTVRTRCEGWNFAELRARPPGPETFHRQHAAVALAASLSRSPLRRAVKRGANALLSAARLGDTLKVWAMR